MSFRVRVRRRFYNDLIENVSHTFQVCPVQEFFCWIFANLNVSYSSIERVFISLSPSLPRSDKLSMTEAANFWKEEGTLNVNDVKIILL